MAATELTGARPRPRPPAGGIGRAWVCAYTAIWSVTLTAAAVVALGGAALSQRTRGALGLALTPAGNPPPSPERVLALAAHNVPIAAWPLLLGLLADPRRRIVRHAADGLVAVCLLANAAPVGAALGAYGARVLPYVPQLPIEWAGLALGYGSWLVGRRRTIGAAERAGWLTAIILVLVLAAIIETVAVPHR